MKFQGIFLLNSGEDLKKPDNYFELILKKKINKFWENVELILEKF